MRILVTGANGFLGAHAAARLAQQGYDVRATARQPPPAGAQPGIEPVAADLAQSDLAPLVEGCDAVVHCAARASPWGPRELFLRDNVLATQRLVDAATAHGVRRFVHISSPSIYFRYQDAWDIGEDVTPPVRWPTAYAETKWLSEQRVFAARAIGPVALRPRAIFGAGDRAILPRLVAVARRGFFPLPAGGRATVDVTCVENAVDAIELALHAPAAAEGRAFNITNGEPLLMRELLAQLFSALDMPVRTVPLPRGLALGLAACAERIALLRAARAEPAITRYGMGLLAYTQTLSITAARQVLGYRPRLSTGEGLQRFASGSRPA